MTGSISIEPLHLYGGDLSFQRIESELSNAIPVVGALVESLPPDVIPRICFLIDDHSNRRGQADPSSDIPLLLQLWHDCVQEHSSLALLKDSIPYVALESKLVGYAEVVKRHIVPSPVNGQGSWLNLDEVGTAARVGKHKDLLTNYGRHVSNDCQQSVHIDLSSPPLFDLSDLTQHRGIGIVCSLILNDGGPMPSCSLLAATWQLYRLGYFAKDAKSRNGPFWRSEEDFTGLENPSHDSGTRELEISDRTFTVLAPSYIAVEHAVRLILHHLILTPRQATSAQGAIEDAVSRIAYTFLPSNWNTFATI